MRKQQTFAVGQSATRQGGLVAQTTDRHVCYDAVMIANRTVFTADNLPILRGMDSESVDLIYLDPPFNSNRNYAAPIGSEAAGASFKDAWTFEDTDAAWWGELADESPALYKVIDAAGAVGGKGDKAYLIYMAIRLLEMKRILKTTGSIYLHCDPTMSHPLKMTMDAIFSKANFLNEIVWFYRSVSAAKRHFPKKHDVILFYSVSDAYRFHIDDVRESYDEKTIKRYEKPVVFPGGYKATLNPKGRAPFDVWQTPPIRNVSKERVGYPTQKPRALLDRIIKASSNEGDLVLDPFCGCATTCIVAEMLGRQWIGIDISPRAIEIVKMRAKNEIGDLFPLIHRTDIPKRDAPPRSKTIKHLLFGRQEGACAGCNLEFPYRILTLDHIVPTSKGGADTDDTLQLLCSHCNSLKGNRDMAYLLACLKASGITSDPQRFA